MKKAIEDPCLEDVEEELGKRGLIEVFRANPGFRKLYISRLISQFGDWFNLMAIIHLLGREEGAGALPFAFVLVLKILPYTLLGPMAGILADRFNRKHIQVGCNLTAALVVLGLLLAGKTGSHALIYAFTVLQVSISAIYEPARQALLPDLVPKRDLVTANALYSVTWSAMYALGSLAGSLTVAAFGWEAAIWIDSSTYLVSALILSGIRWKPRKRGRVPRASLSRLLGIEDYREGLRYIAGHLEVRRIILAKFGWGTMGAITLFLTLLGRTEEFRIQESADKGVGFLWFCRAVGTGVGPILARAWAGESIARLKRTITLGFFLAIGLYLALSFTHDRWLGGILITVAHFGGSAIWVMCSVLLMKMVPDEFRGRTFAAELGLVMLSSSLSTLFYAWIIDVTSMDLWQTIRLAACVCLLPAFFWTFRSMKA